ncbi:MAG: TfoX/Sxy family protein [Deltaproteobacteria bacterium]|nr:TfoX/Sxy family protein [Deltaproteobacteria bacterium]
MPYNTDLEYRIDQYIGSDNRFLKKKMFGGVAYLLNGNMSFGVHKDFLIIRTSKEKGDELLRNELMKPFDITGKPMKGWVMASPDAVSSREELIKMLKIGMEFAESLPSK